MDDERISSQLNKVQDHIANGGQVTIFRDNDSALFVDADGRAVCEEIAGRDLVYAIGYLLGVEVAEV